MSIELSISGTVDTSLEVATQQRLASLVDAGEPYVLDEYIYARAAAPPPGAPTLRVKNLRTASSGGLPSWTLQIQQVPEPRRAAPRAFQFGVTEFAVDGGHSPRALATSTGYAHSQFSLRKTGWVYRRGEVEIRLYRLGAIENERNQLYPDTLLMSVTTRYRVDSVPGDKTDAARFATNGDSGEQREAALAALEEIAGHMRGLVELGRAD
ncbi:hypothetical protein JCM10908_006695 [Rhodotorula pacifica]|uniref:uncharacterized protein n=1 Tax=Rhodotorula pacifica TaxID=1495444 RepID=UPI003172D83A